MSHCCTELLAGDVIDIHTKKTGPGEINMQMRSEE